MGRCGETEIGKQKTRRGDISDCGVQIADLGIRIYAWRDRELAN
jgi:hypothetical protein